MSLDAQRARLEAYALAMDLVLVGVIDDPGESAKSLERPGLQRVLAMLDGGDADALLVKKLDRLTRSVRGLGELVERYFASRFSLMSVSDTRAAAGRLLNVLMSVAQWEREACGERTLRAGGGEGAGRAARRRGPRVAPAGRRRRGRSARRR